MAPSQITNPGFAKRFKFIYFKFRPNRWWYGNLLTLRSLAIALVVVLAPDAADIQYLLMQFLLTGFALSHAMLQPFEDTWGNALEGFVLMGLIMLIGVGALFTGQDSD